MIAGIDHIAVCVRNLEGAVADYGALLGRQPVWRGSLEGHVHAWFDLGNTALDIVSPDGQSEAAQQTREQIDANGEGIWGLGFACPDLEATTHTLERRGVALFPAHVTQSHDRGGKIREWRMTVAHRKS